MFRGESRESFAPPEAVQDKPFFQPSSLFEHHLAARNGKRGGTTHIDASLQSAFPGWAMPEQSSAQPKKTEKKKRMRPPTRPEFQTKIILECGCNATMYPDGRLFPHHIHGCDGKEN